MCVAMSTLDSDLVVKNRGRDLLLTVKTLEAWRWGGEHNLLRVDARMEGEGPTHFSLADNLVHNGTASQY